MGEPGQPSLEVPAGRAGTFPWTLAFQLVRDPYRGLPRLAQQRGDVAALRLGPRRIVLVSHPEGVREVLASDHQRFTKGGSLEGLRALLGDGLITSEGADHARQRRALLGQFGRGREAAWGRAVAAATARCEADWHDGEVRDAQVEMLRLSLDVTARTLFDEPLEPDRLGRLQRAAATINEVSVLTSLPGLTLWLRTPLRPFRRFLAARAELREWASELIERRRQDPSPPDDVLQGIISSAPGAEEARDQVLTFLMAAHVTTGHALAWALYLLARHPAVAERLAAEAERALDDAAFEPPDAARLPYSRAVFAEALRLYPPAWAIGRQADCPVTLGDRPLRRGDLVLLSPWVTQRSERWFEEPESFRPERWLRSGPVRFSYFPFGLGPRRCIGEPLAWLEGMLALAILARQWRFSWAGPAEPEPAHPEPAQPKLRQGVTLAARDGLPVHIHRR